MSRKWEIGRVRALRGLLATGLFLFGAVALAGPLEAQQEWRFGSDPFTDLWFHGLALVGFDGAGRSSLYRDGYAWEVMGGRRAAGVEASPLERERGRLSTTFLGDPAFEVLHFVPLYLVDVDTDEALAVLDPRRSSTPTALNHRAARGAEVLRHLLESPEQREALSTFLDGLRSERPLLPAAPATSAVAEETQRLWHEAVEPALRGFFEREGFGGGRVILAPSLGAEGRFVETDRGPLVVVGAGESPDPAAVAAGVFRELCFPAVRRAVAAYASRLPDRRTASDVSDQAATRCGALLVAEHVPGLVEAYRGRYGVIATRAAFLSAAGFPPAVAALERDLDRALVRELDLNQGGDRAKVRSAGR